MKKIELNSNLGVILMDNINMVKNEEHEKMIHFSLKKEDAQKLMEYIQAVRNKGIDMETYLQSVFDTVYQDVCQVQEISAEINEIIYEGLANSCF